jgi:uncharacterized protein
VRTVARLSVTPVKSLGLSHPEAVKLERFGAIGNRQFYVASPDGTLLNGARIGPLAAIRADCRRDGGREWLTLRFPDGAVAEGEVQVGGSIIRSSFYGRLVAGRAVSGRWTRALSEYVGEPVMLVRCAREGAGNDEAAASIFSTASAEELARRSGSDRPLDSRRFRMLVEVAGCEPHEEDTWVGREVHIGQAVVEVIGPVARCVVTTQDPSTGERDFDTLKAISAYRGLRDGNRIDFGVYADVLVPGTVRVGDPVQPSA